MASTKAVEPDIAWADAANLQGRRTAHEFVKDSLRRAILRGELSGGARLIQSELASTLNVSTTPVREALRDLATEGLITLDASSPEAAALLAQFPAAREHSLFIVDPLGNLMMRHDASHTTKDLLSDLKKLLKLSHIG